MSTHREDTPSSHEISAAIKSLKREEIGRAKILVNDHRHARKALGATHQYGECPTADWAFSAIRNRCDAFTAMCEWSALAIYRGPLVLVGPNGRGKSVAAARWCGFARGVWLSSGVLDSGPFDGGPSLRAANQAHALVVDDLGMEGPNGQGRKHLSSLITRRVDAGRPTLITTTLPMGSRANAPGTIAGEYPGSVWSRLSRCWSLAGGDDLRAGATDPDMSEVIKARSLVDVDRKLDGSAAGNENAFAVLGEGLCHADVIAEVKALSDQNDEWREMARRAGFDVGVGR